MGRVTYEQMAAHWPSAARTDLRRLATSTRLGRASAVDDRWADPAGNFSEYYSDMDCIVVDQLWMPEDLEGARGLFAWGPPPPSPLHPEDPAARMTGAHSAR